MKIELKVRQFENKENETIKYYVIVTTVDLFGKPFEIELIPKHKGDKRILLNAFGAEPLNQ